MDKLEESEAARLEEKKEAEYKPVVMGKCLTDYRHGQPIPDSHSTMRVQIRLPMSVYFVFQYIYVICCEKREARRSNHRSIWFRVSSGCLVDIVSDHSQLIPKTWYSTFILTIYYITVCAVCVKRRVFVRIENDKNSSQ